MNTTRQKAIKEKERRFLAACVYIYIYIFGERDTHTKMKEKIFLKK